MTRQEFIETLAPYAVQLRVEGSPMFPSVRLAQNILETGGVIHPWYNLGGIKATGQPNEWWDGSYVEKTTWEVVNGRRVNTVARFRSYPSIYHFYKDQDRLFQNLRYERVRNAKTPEEQATMLQVCGYATDPSYPGKLIALINAHDLKRYDREAEQVIETIKQLQEQVQQLQREVSELKQNPDQTVSDWAKVGHDFVTQKRNGWQISDGTRPKDLVTREELWTMLERYNRLVK